jgi:hypothetical protein
MTDEYRIIMAKENTSAGPKHFPSPTLPMRTTVGTNPRSCIMSPSPYKQHHITEWIALPFFEYDGRVQGSMSGVRRGRDDLKKLTHCLNMFFRAESFV